MSHEPSGRGDPAPTTPPPAAEPWWVPTLFDVAELRASLTLDLSPERLEAPAPVLLSGHGGVLGAQLLAQQVAAAEGCFPGFVVLHSGLAFLRASSCLAPLHIVVRPLARGRTVVQASVSFVQGDDLIAEGHVQLRPETVDDATPPPAPAQPPTAFGASSARALWPWPVTQQVVTGDGVSSQWARIPDASEGTESRALLAFATESVTIPLAIDLRGQRSLGGALAQAVVSHQTTFLAPFSATRWHRYLARIAATRGRNVVGTGQVHDDSGTVVVTTETTAVLQVE